MQSTRFNFFWWIDCHSWIPGVKLVSKEAAAKGESEAVNNVFHINRVCIISIMRLFFTVADGSVMVGFSERRFLWVGGDIFEND